MADWNSELYLKFAKERTRPSIDLAAALSVDNPTNILDIGCGPGNSTNVLRDRYPYAYILGIDSSPDMIAKAKSEYSDIFFTLCNAKNIDSLNMKFDVIFSNACLQWIPDHDTLIPYIFTFLNKGGTLAVQMPINYNEPAHKILAELAQGDKWRDKLTFKRELHTLRTALYFDILSSLTDTFDIWETTYVHRLRSYEEFALWYSSTGMKPYLDRLEQQDKAEFTADFISCIEKEYPIQENGEIIFRFPRLFFTAQK